MFALTPGWEVEHVREQRWQVLGQDSRCPGFATLGPLAPGKPADKSDAKGK